MTRYLRVLDIMECNTFCESYICSGFSLLTSVVLIFFGVKDPTENLMASVLPLCRRVYITCILHIISGVSLETPRPDSLDSS